MLSWFNKTDDSSILPVTEQLSHLFTNGVQVTINELLPYQTKTKLIDIAATKNLHSKLSGNYLSRSKGQGMEFDEVRHYQTGDDVRAIDWRVTARTGKTHTKLFREEVERPVLIATDLTASMKFGSQLLFKSVQASHVASLIAWHVKARGDRIGGIVFNNSDHCELKPRSRKAGVLHYLHALSQIDKQTVNITNDKDNATDNSLDNQVPSEPPHHAFEDNCARLRQLSRPGTLVYLITDGQHINESALRHLTKISQHCELVVCLISDPLEYQLPQSSYKLNVALTDGEQEIQLTLGDKQTAEQYQQQASSLKNKREKSLVNAGARVVHFSAGESIETQLKNGSRA